MTLRLAGVALHLGAGARCGVLGPEVPAADAAGDRPRAVLLSPDPERPGRLATAGNLEPLADLAGRLLVIAILTVLPLALALAAEQPQAAEGVTDIRMAAPG